MQLTTEVMSGRAACVEKDFDRDGENQFDFAKVIGDGIQGAMPND
jgi:hypothetical protein